MKVNIFLKENPAPEHQDIVRNVYFDMLRNYGLELGTITYGAEKEDFNLDGDKPDFLSLGDNAVIDAVSEAKAILQRLV